MVRVREVAFALSLTAAAAGCAQQAHEAEPVNGIKVVDIHTGTQNILLRSYLINRVGEKCVAVMRGAYEQAGGTTSLNAAATEVADAEGQPCGEDAAQIRKDIAALAGYDEAIGRSVPGSTD